METLLLELRHALPLFRKRPLLAAVVILTLALAIGANTAIFSVVYAALLRPLALPDSDRLVLVELHGGPHRP